MAIIFVRKAQRYISRFRMLLTLLRIGHPCRRAWVFAGEIVVALRGAA